MNKKLLALYSLKFNPFSPQVPASALWTPERIESFCWRIEQQIGEGGFALALGDPGSGKSAALRILAERLGQVRDLSIGVLSRPQAQVADFYRELGALFGVALSPHNRWNSANALREKWLAHIDSSLYRPVLIVDEAQEMNSAVFCELRLLSSADLDSRSILTIVLAGDRRLAHRLEGNDLLPIASRIRNRLRLDALSPKELQECLHHLCAAAGNRRLMAAPLVQTLCEHAAGNLRLLSGTRTPSRAAAAVARRACSSRTFCADAVVARTTRVKSEGYGCRRAGPALADSLCIHAIKGDAMFDTLFAKFAILVLSFIDALLVSLGIATSSRNALAPAWDTVA